jgi:5-methylthioadenosine/S-adenosylhomocysteine deaminase
MDLPVAVHLAESPAESALLARGTGPFAQAWRGRGIPMPAPAGRTPVQWLDEHGVLSGRTLCIHVVQATGLDIGRLANAGAAVAHCPRSNHAHGHGDAPLAALLAARLRVGLGTDSVLSVGELDLLAEARAARAIAGLDPSRTLALCTLDGARALGLESGIGSLRAGKWGDCVVVRPPSDAPATAPEEMVLASGPPDVLATFVGGRDVHRNSRPL